GIGVLRFNTNRQTIDGRVGRVFCRAPISAEAIAVHTSILLASRTNASTVTFSDCSQLVRAIYDEEDQWSWECSATIASIRRLMACYRFIEIQHCNMNVVVAVDRIAKSARDGFLPPNWLSSLL
ncbi:hypothetical protein LINPERPRIM_LOCUS18858, partial [Linum perenne]